MLLVDGQNFLTLSLEDLRTTHEDRAPTNGDIVVV